MFGSIVRNVAKLPSYIRALGASGAGVFLSILVLKLAGRPATIRLGGDPIHLRSKTDVYVFEDVFIHHSYDCQLIPRGPDLIAHYEAIVRSGKTPLIVDCGANIGLSARYFRQVFPDALVVAIEAEAENFSQLERNCAGPMIEPVLAGVWPEPGYLRIVDDSAGSDGFAVERAESGLPAVTISGIFADHPHCEPFIVKVDIEGGERELFSRNTEWLENTPAVVAELHDRLFLGKGQSRSVLKAFAQLDRDFFYVGENVYSVDNTQLKTETV